MLVIISVINKLIHVIVSESCKGMLWNSRERSQSLAEIWKWIFNEKPVCLSKADNDDAAVSVGGINFTQEQKQRTPDYRSNSRWMTRVLPLILTAAAIETTSAARCKSKAAYKRANPFTYWTTQTAKEKSVSYGGSSSQCRLWKNELME